MRRPFDGGELNFSKIFLKKTVESLAKGRGPLEKKARVVKMKGRR